MIVASSKALNLNNKKRTFSKRAKYSNFKNEALYVTLTVMPQAANAPILGCLQQAAAESAGGMRELFRLPARRESSADRTVRVGA